MGIFLQCDITTSGRIGTGYPDGLSSDDIPLFASIIAIADTFDAMTSTRPYRKAFSQETALQEIVRVAGNQLRADLVAVFVGLMIKEAPMKSRLPLESFTTGDLCMTGKFFAILILLIIFPGCAS